MKKWIIGGIIILVILVVLVGLTFFKNPQKIIPKNVEDLYACNFSEDCIAVVSHSYCSCPIFINKKYFDYYESLPIPHYDPSIACSICPSVENVKAKCDNERCGYDVIDISNI